MKTLFLSAGFLIAMAGLILYIIYGTVTPCGIVRDQVRQAAARAGGFVGFLSTVVSDNVIDGLLASQYGKLSPGRCIAIALGAKPLAPRPQAPTVPQSQPIVPLTSSSSHYVPLTIECVSDAAKSFSIPLTAFWTLIKTESGHVGQCVRQTNGDLTCGPAQIDVNIWAPLFANMLHRSNLQVTEQIRDNGCFNVTAAAFILRTKINDVHGDLWAGLIDYDRDRDGVSATLAATQNSQLRLQAALHALSSTPNSGP